MEPELVHAVDLDASGTRAEYVAALEAVRPELEAVPDNALVVMNFDIGLAVLTCFRALPALHRMRARIAVECPAFDLARFDRLETYARALALADARYQAAILPPEPLEVLGPQAMTARASLLRAADTIVGEGVFPAKRIQALRALSGLRNMATVLLTLSEMFRRAWARIDGHTFVTPADLDRAAALANRLFVALAKRDQTDPLVAAAALTRRRAATAFVRAYEDARRVVTFLRWHDGDADKLAPSIYVRKARKRAALAAGTAAPGRTVPDGHAGDALPTNESDPQP